MRKKKRRRIHTDNKKIKLAKEKLTVAAESAVDSLELINKINRGGAIGNGVHWVNQ